MGSEGCGIIVEVGTDLANEDLIGKKVAFLGSAWSKFVLHDFKYCMLLDDSI